MKPVEFAGSNVVFAKDQPEYLPLPAQKTTDGQVTTCWKLSAWERVKLLFTGRLFLRMLTFNAPLQPVLLSVDSLVETPCNPVAAKIEMTAGIRRLERAGVKIAVIVLCLVGLVGNVRADLFSDKLKETGQAFAGGPITNFFAFAGPAYNTATHAVGGLGGVGYNLPKMPLPYQPYLVPVAGVRYLDTWTGFDGTLGLKANLYILSAFAGGNTNSWMKKAYVTPSVYTGIDDTLSGDVLGGFKVPGKGTPGALQVETGEGISTGFRITKSFDLGIWFARTKIQGQPGDNLEGGFAGKFILPGS